MKMKIPLAVAALLLLCLAGWTQLAKAQRSRPMQQAWEYRVDMVPGKTVSAAEDPTQQAAIHSLMNQRGADGWELAGVGGYYYYFKRPR